MTFDYQQWQSDLTQLISDTLGEFRNETENGSFCLGLPPVEWRDRPRILDAVGGEGCSVSF